MRKKSRGFTLIELVAIIAILGILVLLATPKFFGHTEKARLAQIKNDVKVYENVIEVKRTEDVEFIRNWDSVSKTSLEEGIQNKTLYDKRGLIKNHNFNDSYFLVDKSLANSKLPGKFVIAEEGKVFYIDKVGIIDGGTEIVGTCSSPLPQKPFSSGETYDEYLATDADFEWVNRQEFANVNEEERHKYGYLNNKGQFGYYRYKGNSETVKIPHVIDGTSMTSYLKIFSNSHSGLKKVISDNQNITVMDSSFAGIRTSGTLDLNDFYTNNVKTLKDVFSGTSAQEILMDSWNTSNVENMYGTFYSTKVSNLDICHWDFKKVKDFSFMFYMATIPNLDLSYINSFNVESMWYMFGYSNINDLNLKELNTSNVKTMEGMFEYANIPKLDLSGWNVSKLESMKQMFYNNYSNEIDLSGWNTVSLKDMESTFIWTKAKELNLSHFKTDKVEIMENLFYEVAAEKIDVRNWKNTLVKDMSDMFFYAENLKELKLDGFETSNVKDMSNMFYGVEALEKLNLTSFDTSNVENMRGMFGRTHLNLKADISSFDFSNVMDNIDNIFPVSHSFPDSRATFYLGSQEYVDLLSQEIYYSHLIFLLK